MSFTKESNFDWEKHLESKLKLPFWAEVSDYQEKGPIQIGDKVKIHEISGDDDIYGIIVKLTFGRKIFHFPLVDLEPINDETMNDKIINEYKESFSEHL